MPKKIHRAKLLKKLKVSWHKGFLHLIPLGGFSSGNHVMIYHDGDEAFLALFQALDEAQISISIETYILAADRVGLRVRDSLIKAARRGVLVTVLYDHVGSTGISSSYFRPLAEAGVKILAFSPIWPWRRRGPLLIRDHRKIVVIDNKIAFCGSMNISADYAGPLYGNNRFRDTMAKIKGPAVLDLLAITKESIAETEFETKPFALEEVIDETIDKAQAIKQFLKRLIAPKTTYHFTLRPPSTLVQVLRSNQRRNLLHIQKSMEEAVNRAVHYCYFTTPYFLPHEGLRKALVYAARRGVDVRILTAGLSDMPLMRYASRHVYQSLLTSGVRIYEMTKKTLHAKIATIDGIYSSIGSYNLDNWSARRNLEVNLGIIDQTIALELKEQFKEDVRFSEEVHKAPFAKRSLFRKFLCWLAYLLWRI